MKTLLFVATFATIANFSSIANAAQKPRQISVPQGRLKPATAICYDTRSTSGSEP